MKVAASGWSMWKVAASGWSVWQVLLQVLLQSGLVLGSSECRYALEILLVQDGSSSFIKTINDMGNSISSLVKLLNSEFGEVRLGVSSFSDKPLPGRGFGKYGGYGIYTTDYCYRRHAKLTTDVDALVAGFGDMSRNMGNGGDFTENSLEGMMLGALDPELGWTRESHTGAGLPVARLVVMVTDDLAHMEGEAKVGADIWSGRSSYGPAAAFGGAETKYVKAFINGNRHADYDELVALYETERNSGTLSPEQTARKQILVEQLGPETFAPLVPHPGTFPVESASHNAAAARGAAAAAQKGARAKSAAELQCEQTEYPALATVGKVLKDNNVEPLVLVAKPPLIASTLRNACKKLGYDKGKEDLCLQKYYTDLLIGLGFSKPIVGIIAADNTDSIYGELVSQISTTVDKMCLQTTPAPVPPGSEPTPATHPAGFTTTTTTTAAAAGPPIAVIAGATAGAVAGVAAIAGILWKKFGIGAIHKPDAGAEGIGQANVAEEPVDREGVQNIEASMFQ